MPPDLHDLLVKTSRTFALSIPLLEEPTREQVTIAYLLFRIADTFEDAAVWSRVERVAALEGFAALVADGGDGDAGEAVRSWVEARPTAHAGYLELLAATPAVLRAFEGLRASAREPIRRDTVRTALGMAAFVRRADDRGVLRLESLTDLRDYCYVVAGIVGEMLTDLFLDDPRLDRNAAELLRRRAATFGEALQLVNILRDASDDRREGRTFLPDRVSRDEVFELAREDLRIAEEYTDVLRRHGAPAGTLAFTTLPVRLARATLDAVAEQGPGAKVPREEVLRMFQEVSAG
ncbi:MAG TPA: squalene/phytoene synthase family protein [Thermoanaerobaculia bacterium]|nr:squalene/phytoene synthase family protein [Thermoanaerobaculia bacterium]